MARAVSATLDDMKAVLIALTTMLFVTAALPCEFKYEPAAAPKYYRVEGWKLPGIDDCVRMEKPKSPYVIPDLRPVPDAQARYLAHAEPYIVEFPAQTFTFGGTTQKMRPVLAKAVVVRWEVHGKVVAYSYGLTPVSAKKQNGKWIIESEVACTFTGTFIDDKGDGVFRVLVPGSLTSDLIPSWVRKTTSLIAN